MLYVFMLYIHILQTFSDFKAKLSMKGKKENKYGLPLLILWTFYPFSFPLFTQVVNENVFKLTKMI